MGARSTVPSPRRPPGPRPVRDRAARPRRRRRAAPSTAASTAAQSQSRAAARPAASRTGAVTSRGAFTKSVRLWENRVPIEGTKLPEKIHNEETKANEDERRDPVRSTRDWLRRATRGRVESRSPRISEHFLRSHQMLVILVPRLNLYAGLWLPMAGPQPVCSLTAFVRLRSPSFLRL